MGFTNDVILGGRVRLQQPAQGFRSGVDAVFLAAGVPARPGQSVLDIGCGAGAAGLCLAMRVSGLQVCGLEIQPEYARLARLNGEANQVVFDVVEGDIADPPATLRAQVFDHVLSNPPYFRAGARRAARDAGREAARAQEMPLDAWIDGAIRRTAPRGTLTVIQKADRLADVLSALDKRMGSIEIKPLAPRDGRGAELVIVRAKKGGRAALRLCAPLVLHRGERHISDTDHYTAEADAILRDAGVLIF